MKYECHGNNIPSRAGKLQFWCFFCDLNDTYMSTISSWFATQKWKSFENHVNMWFKSFGINIQRVAEIPRESGILWRFQLKENWNDLLNFNGFFKWNWERNSITKQQIEFVAFSRKSCIQPKLHTIQTLCVQYFRSSTMFQVKFAFFFR